VNEYNSHYKRIKRLEIFTKIEYKGVDVEGGYSRVFDIENAMYFAL